MRIPLLLTMALFVVACGEGATTSAEPPSTSESTTSITSTTSSVAPPTSSLSLEDTAAFVIGPPPEGYRATNADGRYALAEVSYGNRGCRSSDWDAQVRVTEDFDLFSGRPGEHDPHILPDGTEVEILDMWDDGRPYGYGASWELGDGRWVTVRYYDVFSVDEFRAGIDSLVPIDAAEWSRLSRALSIDTHVGRPDTDADDVTVDLGELAGAAASVTFHRPGDYPLGDDDCRQACYSLVHSGVTIPDNCATFPLVLRVEGAIIVAALLDSLVETVWIDVGRGVVVGDDVRREVESLAVPGMPTRFFAVAVPPDWCHYVATSPDADFGTGLGEGGIPSFRPDSAGCDFDVDPTEYEEPEICHQAEHDWVASTTTLREVECGDFPAAATSTTAPPEDGD